jgi:hypothetical protein
MPRKKKARGRPRKYPMPDFKPHPDGREVTAESLAEAFLRLPTNHEWEYLKETGEKMDGVAI